MLILCGSSMSFMEQQVLGYKSPLYGRRTAQFKIQPFDYSASSEFVPRYSPEDKSLVYGITGGIPRYLELIDDTVPLSQNIVSQFFSTQGYLFEEPSNLLTQELRDAARYNSVIEAIAEGATRLNEIAEKCRLESGITVHCISAAGGGRIRGKNGRFVL